MLSVGALQIGAQFRTANPGRSIPAAQQFAPPGGNAGHKAVPEKLQGSQFEKTSAGYYPPDFAGEGFADNFLSRSNSCAMAILLAIAIVGLIVRK